MKNPTIMNPRLWLLALLSLAPSGHGRDIFTYTVSKDSVGSDSRQPRQPKDPAATTKLVDRDPSQARPVSSPATRSPTPPTLIDPSLSGTTNECFQPKFWCAQSATLKASIQKQIADASSPTIAVPSMNGRRMRKKKKKAMMRMRMKMNRKKKDRTVFSKGKGGKGKGGKGKGGKGMMRMKRRRKRGGKGSSNKNSGKGGGKGSSKGSGKGNGKGGKGRRTLESTEETIDGFESKEYVVLEGESSRRNPENLAPTRRNRIERRQIRRSVYEKETSPRASRRLGNRQAKYFEFDESSTRDLASKGKGSKGGSASGKGSYGSMSSKGKGSSDDCDRKRRRRRKPKRPEKKEEVEVTTRAFDIFDLAVQAYAVSVCKFDPSTGLYESVCVDSYDLDAFAMQYEIYCGCCTSADEPGEKPDFCEPSRNYSEFPSSSPTASSQPSGAPSPAPSHAPSASREPSAGPSPFPSDVPTSPPSGFPSKMPSSAPSLFPSKFPSSTPSELPSSTPTTLPSSVPSTSVQPSLAPSLAPSVSQQPTSTESNAPSVSFRPSLAPSSFPTQSLQPSPSLSNSPSLSLQPSANPSSAPSKSFQPSTAPSIAPSVSEQPSTEPSNSPTASFQPSSAPSSYPSSSIRPSALPSASPSASAQPSMVPSSVPSSKPSSSLQPSAPPSPEFGELLLNVTANYTFNEDETLDLSGFVEYIDRVPRSDEEINVEITNYPAGTKFFLGTEEVTTVVNGTLLIPADDLSELTMQAPEDFSGRFTFDVRATLREDGEVVVATEPVESVLVDVLPVADNVNQVRLIVVEDQEGPFFLGSNISDNFRFHDDALGEGNNNATETLIEFRIKIPEDTETFFHTVGGVFGGLSGTGTETGSGTAEIIYDANPDVREYIIRSTLVPKGANSSDSELVEISQADRERATADILDTLALFELSSIGPNHTDLDGDLTVTAVTADVNTEVVSEAMPPGAADKTETTWAPLRVQAIADPPSVEVVSPAGTITEEDATSIPLSITITPSPDQDDSEVLSVNITVPKQEVFFPIQEFTPIGTIRYDGDLPAGVSISLIGDGSWLIEADGDTPEERLTRLNDVLNGGNLVFDPRDGWAGVIEGTDSADGITVEVISTERANGIQVAPPEFGGEDGDSKIEKGEPKYIGLEVIPVADVPTVEVKGNAIGLEDELNFIPIEVTLNDPDGSESYIMSIVADDLPAGTRLFGQNGTELFIEDGSYLLTPEDVEEFALLPPLHYSSALSGDIDLEATAIVTDGNSTATFTLPITVEIDGVADKPGTNPITVVAQEDEPYILGGAINFTEVLIDTDTSERLSLRLEGLPAGVIPTSETGTISYIGNGNWNIGLDAVDTLQIPPVLHYSGEEPYPELQLFAVVQELDGDQATSDPWVLDFDIFPVVDGFGEWRTNSEIQQGAEGGLPLDIALRYSLLDNDGSEEAVSVTFDFSDLIEDAGIAERLAELPGDGTGLTKLVNNYLNGTFSYDEVSGNITALVSDVPGLLLSEELFLFSNQDFNIPVSILVRDSAFINGVNETRDSFEEANIFVDMVGVAEIPTVFAEDSIGLSLSYIPVTLGGESTDNDALLGREPSESVYYIVEEIFADGMPFDYAFVDNRTGEAIGNDRGEYYFLFPEDLEHLAIYTPRNYEGVLTFNLTTVAVENDGDLASSDPVTFTVTFLTDPSNPPENDVEPLPPLLTVPIPGNGTGSNGTGTGNEGDPDVFSIGVEDGTLVLDLEVTPGEGETTDPVVTLTISDLPEGFEIQGAIFNPITGTYSADAADVNAGLVTIVPAPDFSGFFNITVEGTATAGFSASTGDIVLTGYVDPVADGVFVGFSPRTGQEDEELSASISLTPRDIDGSEEIQGEFVYLRIDEEGVLDYTRVEGSEPDATSLGGNLTGYYRIPVDDLDDFKIQLEEDWHGKITGDIRVPVVEPEDDEDGDNFLLSSSTFTIDVQAQADEASIAVPSETVVGNEDESIPLPGLSATLSDTNAENGGEVLSVVITGAPEDTRFSAGSLNDEGSWVFPVDALATLEVIPPEHFSGTMDLTLQAFTFESSNGDEVSISAPFSVQVNPVPDPFLVVFRDITLGTSPSGLGYVNPELRMTDQRGSDAEGERAPEYVTFTFENVPEGVRMIPELGGRLTSDGSGTYVFTGTAEQASALNVITGPGTDARFANFVDVTAVSVDGENALSPAIMDEFRLSINEDDRVSLHLVAVDDSNTLLQGEEGNDILTGQGGSDTLIGADGSDLLIGGPGSDEMTGGNGIDVFQWTVGDLDGSTDTITDFNVSEDILDLSEVFVDLGLVYDPQVFDVNDFLQLSDTIDGAEISLSDGTPLVLLEGVTGFSLEELFSQGSILL